MCMSKGQGAACESRVMFILDQSEKSVVCPWFRPPLTPPNSGGEASGRISPPEPGGVRGGMNQQRSEAPIIINSGYRSAAVNKAVGGVKGSNHQAIAERYWTWHRNNRQILLKVACLLYRYAIFFVPLHPENRKDVSGFASGFWVRRFEKANIRI